MTRCQMANTPCPNEGITLIRIAPAGDRRVCDTHLNLLRTMGAGFRVLEAEGVPVQPRTPWLSSGSFARDLTGRLA